MPALQVRDFPQTLYEQLRDFAQANHRSIAQQTIAAVDQMIHGTEYHPNTETPSKSARKKKLEGILLRASQRAAKRKEQLPSPVEMLHEAREERERAYAYDDFAREYLS